MSKETYTQWYVAGSHALRSACEQGRDAARSASGKFTNPEAKSIAVEGAETADRHEKAFVGFLKDLGEAPNDFKDQIMAGVDKGTELSVENAPDKEVLDVALVNGAQAGLLYYVAGFGGHLMAAEALGMADHAEKLKAMIGECEALNRRYAAVGRDEVSRKAAA